MNNTDLEYFRLLQTVLSQGRVKKNRTGVDTIGIFGAQARFNLSEGFPLLTTKRVWMKGIVHELLWFLSGDTNIKYLVDNDVHIWDGNAYDFYKRTSAQYRLATNKEEQTQEWYINKIKNLEHRTDVYGELGQGTYGGMWRGFPGKAYSVTPCGDFVYNGPPLCVTNNVDQISNVINKLKTNPDDRRMIVSAWHPYWVDNCALPPCHVMFQFHTEELTLAERHDEVFRNRNKYILPHSDDPFEQMRWDSHEEMDMYGIPSRRLNCQLYQRSCDLFLGVPFNIASYALLTHLIAQVVDMVPGDFIHSYGDLHIYTNHIEQVQEQLSREPKELPKLVLNSEVKDLFKFKYEDIKVEGYDPHPTIKAEVAV